MDYEEYIKNRFEGAEESTAEDDISLDFWEGIIGSAGEMSFADLINSRIVSARPVDWKEPDKVRIEIFDSFAGKIPVIYIGNADDFESLVTNLVHKGIRPDDIGKTGASFIYGKSVRFIILSAKPYSNVLSSELGLDEEEWAQKSMLIRRSHECTHFFTKKTYGITNNILHDELMADFIGLYDAFGYYKSEWFLKFLGIIKSSGSRLDVYTRDLTPDAVEEVRNMAVKASKGLEKWSKSEGFASMSNAERIRLMCKTGLNGIACWDE